MNAKRLDNLVTIVTGGGSGFGEGICRLFSAHGAKVVVADINETNGTRVARELSIQGGDGMFVQGDVSPSADVRRLVLATLDHFGALHVMVNNAGISHVNQPMRNVSEELFDRIYAVNVKSIYLSAIHCVPVFRR